MSNLRHDERGFTLIEVIMASVVLLVGILGVATIVNAANGSTTSSKAREQGLALARDLTESARSARYQQLEPTTVVGRLKAMPGFSDVGGTGWTTVRRGIRYTVSFGVCSVDDPSDGTGAHVAGMFCNRPAVQANAATCRALIGFPPKINGTGASGADAGDCGLDTDLDGTVDGLVQASASSCLSGTSVAAGTCDAQPNDFKRLVTLVTWDRGSGSRYVLQQATVPFPGLSAYAGVSSLVLNGYALQSSGYVVGDTPTQLTFAATTSEPAQRVDWLLGGVDQGPFTTWSGSSGTLNWPLGAVNLAETTPAATEVLDGVYVVGARVQDAAGIHGIERSVSVKVNRRWPFAPLGFSIAGSALDAQGRPTKVTGSWSAPPDHDIVGYVLERQTGTTWNAVSGCDGITARTCTDTNPPMGSVSYRVRALDTDPSTGAARAGEPSVALPVTGGASQQPPTVPTFSAYDVQAGGNKVQLWWNASTADPASAIDRYYIYRSGCGAQVFVGWTQGTVYTITDNNSPKNSSCTYTIQAKDLGGTYSGPSPGYVVPT
ncbi:MAG TPA: prepilin-type N-terminal cleavage/methylation domain-containing protein [Baekduia sp.]|nr:prepilin-type N-terminal cleavage/methylation domain-containing protein [Baekduia sp.]